MLQETIDRLVELKAELSPWNENPAVMPMDKRQDFSLIVASCFPEFEDFAELGMVFLGFKITPQQREIARYMQHGEQKAMVAAQRGEAKSTLAALFAVWTLMQDQNEKVLVVSGGEKQASDVAVLVTRMIDFWWLLCWMRPDPSKGDRNSFEKYDVHFSLRRVDKTASVVCLGITANLQGNRATLLIPDDIETTKNSLTQPERAKLELLSKEFGAIVAVKWGRILYLGTPQSKDSVYKGLTARGYVLRIWPGRYPTNEEIERIGEGNIAPEIIARLREDPTLQTGGGLDGSRGKPTDPLRYDEEHEIEKELEYGPEGYQLQFMLDTSLADAQRTKIKLPDIIFAGLDHEQVPETLAYEASQRTQYVDSSWNARGRRMYLAGSTSVKFSKFEKKCMSVDPAGSGGDEVAYGAAGALNSYVHILAVGGLRGGMTEENCGKIVQRAIDLGVEKVWVEANQGVGMATTLLTQAYTKMQEEAKRLGKKPVPDIAFESYWASGQKERRCIDTLGPISRKHKLVMHLAAVEEDRITAEAQEPLKRAAMSVLHQIESITYDRNSLVHDDRIDCLQKVVQECSSAIVVDDEKAAAQRLKHEAEEFVKNPMGYKHNQPDRRLRKGAMRHMR